MTHYTIAIHTHSDAREPKVFSGSNKSKVLDAFNDYICEHGEHYDEDCFLKVTADDITVTSNNNNPLVALKEAVEQFNNCTEEVKFSNMVVIENEDVVEESGDDIDKVEEEEENISDDEEISEENDNVDTTDLPADKIDDDGNVIPDDWDGFLES